MLAEMGGNDDAAITEVSRHGLLRGSRQWPLRVPPLCDRLLLPPPPKKKLLARYVSFLSFEFRP